MKKIALFLIIAISALLASCSSYSKQQTPAQMAQPMNCAGLHLRNAQWHFVDEFNQNVDVVGTCKKGRRHGNFKFTVNGEVVAKTKYSKDIEVKTSCLANGKKTRTTLELCMKANAQNAAPKGEAIGNDDDFGDDDAE